MARRDPGIAAPAELIFFSFLTAESVEENEAGNGQG